MANSEIRSIQCTQCGAPLDLHGGHRVRSLTCTYCGAVMDSHQDYQLVYQYKNAMRPACPLKIGMQGIIENIEFTIIGILQYACEDSEHWLELQIFSPTHGYHWLSYEQGHFIFNRRVRDVPRPTQVKGFRLRGPAILHQRTFKLYEQYDAEVHYVEGELTWIARKGDSVNITEAIAPPYILSYETSANETEYYLGQYLPGKMVYEAFAIEKSEQQKPQGIHAAQPYHAPLITGFGKTSKWFALLNILLVLLLLFLGQGTQRLHNHFSGSNMAERVTFTIEDANHLLELKLDTNLQNHWASYDVIIYQQDKEVYSLNREISFYEGREGGEYWSEGNKGASALFKLPTAGVYQLALIATESSLTKQGFGAYVKLYEGVMVSRYFMMLAGLMLLIWGFAFFHYWNFEARRWQAVEEDDEDD
ncbi:DUF4178 domain-containing protein [Candidatus Venteria ishoeyi]|nr:DUF4178 domain-containing protein [Candidatus Venteria ishoeyi]MDM8548036.1 DUF4178 domain-containing protein [Candidatus Venteria ishoeyi]